MPLTTARNYSNVASTMYTTGSLNNTDSSSTFSVAATQGGSAAAPSNWPSVPFYATLALDASDEEVVYVTTVSGSSVTATRGTSLGSAAYGTSTKSHASGVTIRPMFVAADAAESNAHSSASTNVHGLGSGEAVVGVSSTQTLTNKTLTSPAIGSPAWSGTATGTLTGGTLATPTLNTPTVSSPAWSGTATGTLTGGTYDTATLTNPTINSATLNNVTAGTTSASTVPLTAKGAASQTASLTEWKKSDGTVGSKVGADANVVASTNAAGTAPLTVKNIAAQSANATEWQKSDGTVVSKVNSDQAFTVSSAAAATTPLVVKGPVSASVDLFRVTDSADATKLKVDSAGDTTVAANLKLSDGTKQVNVGASGSGASFASLQANATDALISGRITADTQSRYYVQADGTIFWGPGGSTTQDTNLYRSAAGVVKTDNNLHVAGFTTTSARDDTGRTTSSGTYGALGTLTATCTVPPSGKILINWAGTLSNDTVGAQNYFSISATANGSAVIVASDSWAIRWNETTSGNTIQYGTSYLFNDASKAGQSFVVTPQHRTGSGTHTVTNRLLIVQPLVG